MDGENSNDKAQQPVTITSPPDTQVTVDPQNPLPEPSFFWRRLLAYVVVLIALLFTSFALDILHDLKRGEEIYLLAWWTLAFAALISTYYYIAPSAAELTSMYQNAQIIRKTAVAALSQATNTPENAVPAPPQTIPGTPPSQGSSAKVPATVRPAVPPARDEEDFAPTARPTR